MVLSLVLFPKKYYKLLTEIQICADFVLGGEDIEVDKSCYRLSDVSKTQEATMFQNVREILMFLEKQGVNCSGINSKGMFINLST